MTTRPDIGLSTRIGDLVRRCAHTASGAFVGWFYLAFILVTLPVVLVLSLFWVGLPLLRGELSLFRSWAAGERRWANRLLGTDIDTPAPLVVGEGSQWRRLRVLTGDATTWRSLGYLLVRTLTGIVASYVLVTGIDIVLDGLVGGITDLTGNDHITGTWTGPSAIPLGLLAVVVTVGCSVGIAWLCAAAARSLLSPSAAEKIRALTVRSEELELKTRLARDLHDSVGHAMTAIAVQASAAGQVFDTDPAFARAAHENISSSARQALEELDQMLGLLRDEPTARDDTPTLDDVADLVDRTRAAGLPVELRCTGDVAHLPPAVSEAMYRIVQEGCTNVMGHAGMVPTEVVVDAGTDDVTVEVRNEPPSERPTVKVAGGRGIAGARERLVPLGGSCVAEPSADGGFVLRATAPVRPPS